MRATMIAGYFVCLACLTACSPGDAPGQQAPAATGMPQVYAVNYPLAWAAERLAGDAADVRFPAPEGIDPAFWEPDLASITGFQQADLILLNGANYAKWVGRVSLPQNRMVDTSKSFSDRLIAVDSGPVHSHGPEGGHSHGELAFTVWLDLTLFAQQVTSIADALTELIPDHAAEIEQRRQALVTELTAMDAQLLEVGRELNGAPVLYSHPVYQYLQQRYELNGTALHWEPEQLPSPSEWETLDLILSRQAAKLMLWEAPPAAATLEALEERGVMVVVFNPLGNRGRDFASGLQENIEHLGTAANTLKK